MRQFIFAAVLGLLGVVLFGDISVAATTQEVENKYLEQIVQKRVRVVVSTVNGPTLEGFIKAFDDRTLVLDHHHDILIYKNAVASIRSVDGGFRLSN